MSKFGTLLHKEWVGIWRSKKCIWLPIVFMLLGVMQPLTMYYMEDILKMGGGLPEGAVFQMPTPSNGDIVASVLSQYDTIGLILIVVVVMGAISDERKNGSLTMLLIRPISSFQIIASKAVSNSLLLVLSFVCGYFFSYYYTVVLYGSIETSALIQGLLLYSLYIVFIVIFVLLCSTLWNSNGAIAIVSFLFITLLDLLSSWLTDVLLWSPTNLSTFAVQVVSGGQELKGIVGCLIVTTVCFILMLVISSTMLKKKSI